jgi:hypothetical protein
MASPDAEVSSSKDLDLNWAKNWGFILKISNIFMNFDSIVSIFGENG